MKETIVAIATSTASNAGINIIRLSGPESIIIREKIFYSKKLKDEKQQPNKMYLGTIMGENFSDQAFCVFYKKPNSYTGEDIIEIHCHGGKGIANAVLRLCIEKGARPAYAGEFTKRAFLNGKMNLAEAEGIMEIINAESESEILQSYKLLSGEISKGIYSMEDRILKIIADMEVRLDYPEETEDETSICYKQKANEIIEEINKLLQNSKLAKTVIEGINVAIVGLPNVGKSSLLNGLVLSDRAIVTKHAGTTRDILNEQVEINGIKINFIDTAGIRESANEIEKIGVDRAKEAAKSADVIIFVQDLSQPVSEEEKEIEKLIEGKKVIRVANKSDKEKYPRKNSIKIKANPPHRDIEKIKNAIMDIAARDKIFNTQIITRERHTECLKKAKTYLENWTKEVDSVPVECSLITIREAYQELAKITGNDISDSIVEEVFSTFCVGK